ncbi:MAG: polysaccharide biosynthesis protein [Clostridia bacterium]|nr:polysaccharide biosynthesis protein [Clostridia bacterium]
MKKIRKYRNVLLFLIDILIIFGAYFITAFLMLDMEKFISADNLELISNSIIISLFVYEIVFGIFDLYKNITRYENGKDYIKYILACGISACLVIVLKFIFKLQLVTIKQIVFTSIIVAVGTVAYRVIIRFILTFGTDSTSNVSQENRKNLLIIGAGEAARDIIKTLKTTMRNTYNIVGLIDDNEGKFHYLISGVKVLGDRYKIVEICKANKVDVIFFSIANISNQDKKEILQICQETGAKLRILPGTADLIKNKNVMQNLRDVEIEDILGREPIVLDNENIGEIIKNKPILVTGGGGSIGSELCRQIVKYKPSKLIIFDIYENNLYNIEIELKSNPDNNDVEIVPAVGSVRDKKRLEGVFEKYKPYLVFHAAAHKHVPLMEGSPLEAIKNNIFGTYNTVNCADKYNVKKFILISTDKAVNPTNIMGASKRMCEMIVQAKNKVSKTDYAAVRFGNVLGSNGSVVPLFKKQIAAGGPVTVTHKEITRFFMTIPEAVGLVLQAMSYAKGGEIFVLDMGEPVKIYDLAVSLIKLTGLEPNVDIPIKITGLRPGEKLYEELLMKEEGLTQTEHNKIFIGKPSNITNEELENKIEILQELVADENVEISKIKQTMRKIVPTYKEAEQEKTETNNLEIKQKIDGKKIKTLLKKSNTENNELKVEVG